MKIHQNILGTLQKVADTVFAQNMGFQQYWVIGPSPVDATKYEKQKHRTYHADIKRHARRNFILENIGPMDKMHSSYVINTGNKNGTQIHTLTTDAVIITLGQFDRRVITYLIPSPNFLVKHFQIQDKALLDKAEQNKQKQNDYELTHGKI